VSAWHIIAITATGVAAGTINTVVGSGTLITFPMLLAFGYAPVTANVSNTIGLVPGAASGAFGYRNELTGQRDRVLRVGGAALLGGIVGSILLLVLPASAFKAIVPFFIALALVLILSQKQINRLLGDHRRELGEGIGPVALLGACFCGIYGGYFGAAQGILMLSILGLSVNDTLQRLNAVKVVSTGVTNLVAGVVFVFFAHVAWDVAGLIAAGSIVGGVLGARYGRRLPPPALRALIVVVGIANRVGPEVGEGLLADAQGVGLDVRVQRTDRRVVVDVHVGRRGTGRADEHRGGGALQSADQNLVDAGAGRLIARVADVVLVQEVLRVGSGVVVVRAQKRDLLAVLS
jgi:uncharacterized membrane protein YfcA